VLECILRKTKRPS